jgi:hypothetical protein
MYNKNEYTVGPGLKKWDLAQSVGKTMGYMTIPNCRKAGVL